MVVDPSPLAKTRRASAVTTRARGDDRWRAARKLTLCRCGCPGGAGGVQPHLEPVEAPMQMRTGGTAGHADLPDHLSASDHIADLHCLFALMEITGGNTMPVIENGQAAFEIKIWPNKHDARRRGRSNRCPGRCRNIDAKMRLHWFAVQHALVAERSADDAGNGPVEFFGKPVRLGVRRARSGDHSDFLFAPGQHVGRRCNEFFGQPRDALDFVLPHNGLNQSVFVGAIRKTRQELTWLRLIIRETKDEIPRRRDMQRRAVERYMAAGFHFPDDETSLLQRAADGDPRGLSEYFPRG